MPPCFVFCLIFYFQYMMLPKLHAIQRVTQAHDGHVGELDWKVWKYSLFRDKLKAISNKGHLK